jgi:phosphoenolpyruvate-protein kinase (PTS system EI component)
VWRLPEATRATGPVPPAGRDRERERARNALAAAVEELRAVARRLPPAEAEIVETGALMAQDPLLIEAVEHGINARGVAAAEAILAAADEHAQAIASLADATLAARADDVHSLGRRAARLAIGADAATREPPQGSILLAHDLGPGDVAELSPSLAGIVLAAGGPTAHAAIVARSLGVPMVTGLDEAAREIAAGTVLVIDGASGTMIAAPSPERAELARREMSAKLTARRRAHEMRSEPAVTTDGTRIVVLVNVATREELEVGLRAGAEGIGLLRTELSFLEAAGWPREQQHTEMLEPILERLDTGDAVIRVLDFGADKAPPFLRDVRERGIALLLARPEAFAAQLRAILLSAQRHDVRVLLPMVQSAEQVVRTRALLETAGRSLEIGRIPSLGSMIETPEAARDADAIARSSDFLSIGTNDLTASTLDADRFADNMACAHHPLVLRSIASSVAAAHDAGIPIEVCGEAASDPIMLPLLLGLGIDELSVGAARVGVVREWIRRLSAAEVAGLAHSALTMDTAEEVAWAVRPLAPEHALAG